MKTKVIIATGFVTLALLAGCNKAEEPAATKSQESASTPATPAPAAEPAAPKTEEATPAPAPEPAPATEGK